LTTVRQLLPFLLPLVATLAGCSPGQPDYSWFEIDWISDADVTVAVNPQYTDLSGEDLRTVRERYGRIRWIFDDGRFTYLEAPFDSGRQLQSRYTIEPVDEQRFWLQTGTERRSVWLTRWGFCTALAPDHAAALGLENSMASVECFKPYNP